MNEHVKEILTRVNARQYVKCPSCGTDWTQLDGDVCFDCVQRQLAAEAKIKKMVSVLGGERAALDYTFESFQPIAGTEKALQSANGFDPRKDNLYLWGKCGRGKTFLALAVARSSLLAGRSVAVTKPGVLADAFWQKHGREKVEEYQRWAEIDVLVIDELGFGSVSEWVLEILCEVLDRRYLAKKFGLVGTGNLNLDDMAKKYGDDRLSSRIVGMCKVIQINSEIDMRTRIKK